MISWIYYTYFVGDCYTARYSKRLKNNYFFSMRSVALGQLPLTTSRNRRLRPKMDSPTI